MATFVLVHGGWHGSWCWRKVTPLLRARGHDVFTPTLTGLGERAHLAHPLVGLETQVQDVVNLITFSRQAWEERVRTEGHGWLIPSLRPMPWDEFLREFWLVTDEAERQWMMDRLVPTPFKTFTDPVGLTNMAPARLPRTYLRCVQYANVTFDRFAEMAQRTAGWRCRELATSHEPFITMPRELTEVLLECAA